jgi:Xaa-Pro aminopeptidase
MNQQRFEKIKGVLKERGIDGVLISKKENYAYLSGFNGSAGTLLITPHQKIMFTDPRYTEQGKVQAKDFTVITYKNNFLEALKEKLHELGMKTLGFESEVLSYQTYQEYLKSLEGIELVPLGKRMDALREIKETDEIEKIKNAVRLADLAFAHVLPYIKEGVKELEIAAEIEYFIKKNGARGTSFETIVASGWRSALPHGVASDKKIQKGDPIVLDFGAFLDDYCSDMTRTVFLGEPVQEMKTIYNIVKEAQMNAAKGIIKGLVVKEGDALARRMIENKGYGDQFGHGLGHGVGLEIHEGPTLSYRGNTVLENGMVVTVEPGIYVPNLGGVRIEDIVVIQDQTPQILTSSTKEMVIL